MQDLTKEANGSTFSHLEFVTDKYVDGLIALAHTHLIHTASDSMKAARPVHPDQLLLRVCPSYLHFMLCFVTPYVVVPSSWSVCLLRRQQECMSATSHHYCRSASHIGDTGVGSFLVLWNRGNVCVLNGK